MITDTFDACGVLKIAEQVERNGEKFYRRAAKMFSDNSVSDTLRKLADWEVQHERTFVSMREQVCGSAQRPAPAEPGQIAIGPRAMAGLAVFGIGPDPRDELTGSEGRDEVLKRALEKEKASIAFYEGLRDSVADQLYMDKIDDIINEEVQHVAILNQLL